MLLLVADTLGGRTTAWGIGCWGDDDRITVFESLSSIFAKRRANIAAFVRWLTRSRWIATTIRSDDARRRTLSRTAPELRRSTHVSNAIEIHCDRHSLAGENDDETRLDTR